MAADKGWNRTCPQGYEKQGPFTRRLGPRGEDTIMNKGDVETPAPILLPQSLGQDFVGVC